jgi:hypothetical protein
MYTATYDIKWKNKGILLQIGQLEKSKGWAIYKGFKDFQKHCS